VNRTHPELALIDLQTLRVFPRNSLESVVHHDDPGLQILPFHATEPYPALCLVPARHDLVKSPSSTVFGCKLSLQYLPRVSCSSACCPSSPSPWQRGPSRSSPIESLPPSTCRAFGASSATSPRIPGASSASSEGKTKEAGRVIQILTHAFNNVPGVPAAFPVAGKCDGIHLFSRGTTDVFYWYVVSRKGASFRLGCTFLPVDRLVA
jgi:hypothetical protein